MVGYSEALVIQAKETKVAASEQSLHILEASGTIRRMWMDIITSWLLAQPNRDAETLS